MRPRASTLTCGLVLLACSGRAEDPPAADAYQPLVSADWQLEPGEERFVCARFTTGQDLFVRSIRSVAPPGTHHTVLMSGGPPGPDGTFECDESFGLGARMLFSSGLATPPFDLPEGVALRIEAGESLILNLHLFNASTQPIDGSSRVEFVSVPEADVESEADTVLAGKTEDLTIDPGVSTHTGWCTMPADATLLALWPHMHQLGTHMRVALERDTGDLTLLDRPYDFTEQLYDVIEPVVVRAGERLRVECSYENPGPGSVGFGESSADEMCFAGLVRHPRPELSVSAVCTR